MSDEQIKYMRDRFLSWTLPENLNPDGGISYKRSESAIKYNHPGPMGTNFLDVAQAEVMVRHMVEGLPTSDELTTTRQIAVELAEALESIPLGIVGWPQDVSKRTLAMREQALDKAKDAGLIPEKDRV